METGNFLFVVALTFGFYFGKVIQSPDENPMMDKTTVLTPNEHDQVSYEYFQFHLLPSIRFPETKNGCFCLKK